jgi:hypothetical protein
MACEVSRYAAFEKIEDLLTYPVGSLEDAYQKGWSGAGFLQAPDESQVRLKLTHLFGLIRQLGFPTPTFYLKTLPIQNGQFKIAQEGCTVLVCRCIRPASGYAAVYDFINARSSAQNLTVVFNEAAA